MEFKEEVSELKGDRWELAVRVANPQVEAIGELDRVQTLQTGD